MKVEDANSIKDIISDVTIDKIEIDEYEFNSEIRNLLCSGENTFLYNLGVEVGGPIYLPFLLWIKEKVQNRKIYFNSVDGKVMYNLFEKFYENEIVIIDVPLDSVLLAGITDMDEKSLDLLLRYYNGKSIGTLLSLLNVSVDNDVDANEIVCEDNYKVLKGILVANKEKIVYLATKERAKLYDYLCKIGYYNDNSIVHFSCDWEGYTQLLFERLNNAVGSECTTEFYYYGIVNTQNSRMNVHGMNYYSFLFDFYRNYAWHTMFIDSKKIVELFFYNVQSEINKAIVDYMAEALKKVFDKGIELQMELSINNLNRLLQNPSRKESEMLGISIPEPDTAEYHLEAEDDIREFHRWIRNQERVSNKYEILTYNPLFSIVIPVYNTKTEQLKECIESVLNQVYDNYELILVDDHSSWDNVVPVLKEYEKNEKVMVIYRQENGHISIATNDAINASSGEYIVFMDCDDVIERNALYEFAKLLNKHPEYDFIYSDEDKITEDGKIRHMPFFKPDWSPDLFHCMMYTNHLATYRASIVKEIGGLRTSYNGSQDYDMTLRFMEKSDDTRVGHVPKILYHWRERKESAAFSIGAKNYAANAARMAKLDYLKRNNINGRIEFIPGTAQYRIVYDVIGNPLVSIIIPSKDNNEILKQCIDSIHKYTNYDNYEIIVVDNGSSEANKKNIEDYLIEKKAKYIYEKFEFNFSKMCNIGRKNANGSFLLFLNDDVEVFQNDWLERLIGQAQLDYVGAVGAKLLYPCSTTIQHCGVSNMHNGPSHDFLQCDDGNIHYFSFNRVDSDRIAVTAACLILSTYKFDLVGGFDETFPVAYNDVSLCFSLHEKGLYNVIRNDVVAYHHESLSRGNDLVDEKKRLRLASELERLYNRFSGLKRKDPFLNPNLFHYTGVLALLHNYDGTVAFDKHFRVGTEAVIDSINYSSLVRITGWAMPPNGVNVDSCKRYIIFSDPYGKQYLSETMPVRRDDVVKARGVGEENKYLGFECRIPLDVFAFDSVIYNVGVCTVYKNKYYVTWCTKTSIMNIPHYNVISEKFDNSNCDMKQYKQLDNVVYNIDEFKENEDYLYMRGFAFIDKVNNYNYKRTILLKSTDLCYEYMLFDDTRPDVALAFVDKHFITRCGFFCRVPIINIDKGEYNVFLKFENKFDDSDIYICGIKEIVI